MKKDIKKFQADAAARGWVTVPTKNGHWKMTHPKGGIVFTSGTPSDQRALTKMAADLRRCEKQHA